MFVECNLPCLLKHISFQAPLQVDRNTRKVFVSVRWHSSFKQAPHKQGEALKCLLFVTVLVKCK